MAKRRRKQQQSSMGGGVKVAALGAGAGAGFMYLFDPIVGRRRRARVQDQAAHLWHEGADAADVTQRDLANRSTGLVAGARYRLTGGRSVDDRTLVERVRSEIGRVSRHTRAIDVEAQDGTVTLRGPILRDEANLVTAAVRAVPGVRGLDDQLEVHDSPGDVPSLQAGGPQPANEPPIDVLQENWSPATRFVTGSLAGLAVATGLSRGRPFGWLVTGTGLAVLARAATNKPMTKVTGVGAGRSAVDVQKSITVDAPVEDVFDLWRHVEQFPQFMSNVKEVRPLADGRQHWVIDGPMGADVEFDAEVTKEVANEELAWRSSEGSTIAHAGRVRFEPADGDSTRVTVHLTYNPVAGAVGHGVATLLRSDPKTLLDEDLLRMKTLVETAQAPRDAAQRGEGGPA